MDMIKDIVRQYYPLLILCSCVVFVVHIFFSANFGEGKGIFETAGNLYTELLEESSLESAGLGHLGEETEGCVKSVRYDAEVKEVGDCIKFRSLFQVDLQEPCNYEEKGEPQAVVYLEDIKKLGGDSVLERLTADEIAGLEEIPSAFIYEEESDQLYFFESGVFLVQIKVYGIDGSMERYEFHLPVEVS